MDTVLKYGIESSKGSDLIKLADILREYNLVVERTLFVEKSICRE